MLLRRERSCSEPGYRKTSPCRQTNTINVRYRIHFLPYFRHTLVLAPFILWDESVVLRDQPIPPLTLASQFTNGHLIMTISTPASRRLRSNLFVNSRSQAFHDGNHLDDPLPSGFETTGTQRSAWSSTFSSPANITSPCVHVQQ